MLSFRFCAMVVALTAIALSGHVAAPAGAAAATPLPGACDASDALSLMRAMNAQHKQAEAKSVLVERIVECHREIVRARQPLLKPTPIPWSQAATNPMPSPIPNYCNAPLGDEFALYTQLNSCIAYLKGIAAASSATPSPLPFEASRPTFYVFSTGSIDATTNTVLIRSVVDRLRKSEFQPSGPPPTATCSTETWCVVGRTDWSSIATFATQCQTDPNTEGALVIEADFPSVYSNNYLVVIHNGTRIEANVELVGCDEFSHSPNVSPLVVDYIHDVEGTGRQKPFAVPIGLYAAGFLAFNNKVSSVKTEASSTPSPAPGTTPTPGAASVTTTTTTYNQLTPAFVVSSLNNSLGSLTIPSVNANDILSAGAWEFSDTLMGDLSRQCKNDSKINEIYGVVHQKDGTNRYPSGPGNSYATQQWHALFDMHGYCDTFRNFLGNTEHR